MTHKNRKKRSESSWFEVLDVLILRAFAVAGTSVMDA